VDQARNPFSDLRPGVFSYFQGEGGAGAEPFFQGEGGAGAEPFFQGDGGAGADPFFQGEGGAGAEPFAVNTEPLPLPATAVFRPIAPTSITIAATTVSFRDIVPPRNKLFPEVMYLFRHQCQGARRADLCFSVEKCSESDYRGFGPAEGEGTLFQHQDGRIRVCVLQQYSSTKTSLGLGHVCTHHSGQRRIEGGATARIKGALRFIEGQK
jgi:hypothetical protein